MTEHQPIAGAAYVSRYKCTVDVRMAVLRRRQRGRSWRGSDNEDSRLTFWTALGPRIHIELLHLIP